MKIRACVLREIGKPRPYSDSLPLSIEEVELDPPSAGEVLVQIKAAGLCHSDLVAINGERAKPTPIVIGHEAAGVVTELGEGVDEFEVGDHVVPAYVASCGKCEMCREGRPALCQPATIANAAGTMQDGTTRLHLNGTSIKHHSGVAAFAEYAVISKDALVKIDKSIPFEHAALFGCAVVTGVGSVVNTASVRAGQTVAIVGLGGVGLSALLAAEASSAGSIIAIDIQPDKLDLARQLGAHHVFNATEDGIIDQVRDLTGGGVDFAIETAGSSRALDTAYAITARRHDDCCRYAGTRCQVHNLASQPCREERTLKGSYMGSCIPSRDIPRYLSLFRVENCLSTD